MPIAALFLVAVLTVGSIGSAGAQGLRTLQVVVFFAGFSVLALQYALDTISATVYPTSIRSAAAGWAFAAGRVGSIVGPIVGGYLVGLPIQQLFMFAAIPFAVGTIGAVLLIFAYSRKFGGFSIGGEGASVPATAQE